MSTENLPPEVVSAITTGVKETLATAFIGYSIATTLYGITVLQVYLYFQHYPKDPVFLKLLVLAFWILDTFTSTLVAHSLYTYIVLDFGDLLADERIPWSFALENEIVYIITFMAQSYFACQLLKLWPKAKYFPIAVFMLALGAFALDLEVEVQIFSKLSVEALSERSVYVIGSIVQGLSALCDILITTGLIYRLHSWRTDSAQPINVIIDNLILIAITRGTLTAICQLIFMALNVSMPDHTYWQPFHQAVGKLYVNSVLASLNFRSTFKGPAIPMGRQPASASIPFSVQSDHRQSTYPMSSTTADAQPQIQLDSFLSAVERDNDGISSQGSKKYNP